MERNKFGFGFRSNQSVASGTSSGFNSNLSRALPTTSSSISSFPSAGPPSLFGLISKVNKGILEQPSQPNTNVKKGILKQPSKGILKNSSGKEYGNQVNDSFNQFQNEEGHKQQNVYMAAKSRNEQNQKGQWKTSGQDGPIKGNEGGNQASVFKIPQSIPNVRHSKPVVQDLRSPLTGSDITVSKGATGKVGLSGSHQGDSKPKVISLVDYTDDDTGSETADKSDSNFTTTSYTPDKALEELDMYMASRKSRDRYKTDYDDRDYTQQQGIDDDYSGSYKKDDKYYSYYEKDDSKRRSYERSYSPPPQTDLHSGESYYHDYGKQRSTYSGGQRAEYRDKFSDSDQSYKKSEYHEDTYRGGSKSYSEYDKRARDQKTEDYRYSDYGHRYSTHQNTGTYYSSSYTDRESSSYHGSNRPIVIDSRSSPYDDSRDCYSGTKSGNYRDLSESSRYASSRFNEHQNETNRPRDNRYWNPQRDSNRSPTEDRYVGYGNRDQDFGRDSRQSYMKDYKDGSRTDSDPSWGSRTEYSESSSPYHYGSKDYDDDRKNDFGSKSDHLSHRYSKDFGADRYDRDDKGNSKDFGAIRYDRGDKGNSKDFGADRYDRYDKGNSKDFGAIRYDRGDKGNSKDFGANRYDRDDKGKSNERDSFTGIDSRGSSYRETKFSDRNDSKQVYKSYERKSSENRKSETTAQVGQAKKVIMYEDYLFGSENSDDEDVSSKVTEDGAKQLKNTVTETKTCPTIFSAQSSSFGQNEGLPSLAGKEPGTVTVGFQCKDCNITCADQSVYNVHLRSNIHLLTLQRKAQELFQLPETSESKTGSSIPGSMERKSRFNTNDLGQPLVVGGIQPPGVATTTMITGMPPFNTTVYAQSGMQDGGHLTGKEKESGSKSSLSADDPSHRYRNTPSSDVQVIPPKPMGPLKADSVQLTSVTLTWGKLTEEEEQLIDTYVVEYRNARETKWVTVGSTVKQKYIVEGLQEGTDYLFRVSAVNGPERSEFLESILITTATQKWSLNRKQLRSLQREIRNFSPPERSKGKDISVENRKGTTMKTKDSSDEEVAKKRDRSVTHATSDSMEATEKCKLYDYFPKYSEIPLLGLDFVYEILSHNPAIPTYYICKLCNSKGSGDVMIKHITGFAHKLAFVKDYNSVLYNAIDMLPARKDKLARMTKEAKFIEDKIGRGSVNVMKILNPSDHDGKIVFTDPVPVKAPPTTRPKMSTRDATKGSGGDSDQQAPDESEFLKLYTAAVEADALPDKAIIGLCYIREYLHPKNEDLPMYVCSLCKCCLSHGTILFHVIGKKHRIQFIKKMHPAMYETISKNRDFKKGLPDAAAKIMEQSGLGMVTVQTAKNNRLWRERKKKDGEAGDEAKRDDQGVKGSTKPGEDGLKGIKFGLKKADDQSASVKQSNVFEEATKQSSQEISDWTKENEALQARIQNQSIIKCYRKSKFIETYSSSFKQYPVIGMQWVTEFQKPDPKIEPWFMCFMCQQKLQWKDILSHVTSTAHRFNYLKTSYKDLSKSLYEKMGSSRVGLKPVMEKYTQKVLAIEGHPTEVEVMIELNISSEALKSVMKIKDSKSTSGLMMTTATTTTTSIPSLLSLPMPGTVLPQNQALPNPQQSKIPSLFDTGLSSGTPVLQSDAETLFSGKSSNPQSSHLLPEYSHPNVNPQLNLGKDNLGSENTAGSSRIDGIIQKHAQKVLTEQILVTGQFPPPGTVINSDALNNVNNDQELIDLTGNDHRLKSDSRLHNERGDNDLGNNRRLLSRDRDSVSSKRFKCDDKRDKSVDRIVTLIEKASNRSDDFDNRSRSSDRSDDFESRSKSRAFSGRDERGLKRSRSDRSRETDVGRDRGREDDGRQRRGRYSRDRNSVDRDVEDRELDRSQRKGRYARDTSVDRHRQSRSLSRDDDKLRHGVSRQSREKSRDRENRTKGSRDRERKGRYADSDRYERSPSPRDHRNRDQRRTAKDQTYRKSDRVVRCLGPSSRNQNRDEQDYRTIEDDDLMEEDEYVEIEDSELEEDMNDPSYIDDPAEDQPEDFFQEYDINTLQRTDKIVEEYVDISGSEDLPANYRGRGNKFQRNARGRRGGRGRDKNFNMRNFQATSNNPVDFGNTWMDNPRGQGSGFNIHGLSSQEPPSLLGSSMSGIEPSGLLEDQFRQSEEMHGDLGTQAFDELEDDTPDPSPEEIAKLMRKAPNPNPTREEINQLMHRAKSLMEYIEVMDEEDRLSNQPLGDKMVVMPLMQLLPTGRGQIGGAPRGQFPDRGFHRGNRGIGRGFNPRGQRSGRGRGGLQPMAFRGRGNFRGNR